MDAKKTRNKTTFLKNPRAFKFSFWNMSFPAWVEFSKHSMFQIWGNKWSQPIKVNYDEFLRRIFSDNFEARVNWNKQLGAIFVHGESSWLPECDDLCFPLNPYCTRCSSTISECFDPKFWRVWWTATTPHSLDFVWSGKGVRRSAHRWLTVMLSV